MSGDLTEQDRANLRLRDPACPRCNGLSGDSSREAHHRQRRREGPRPHAPSNLLYPCGRCHREIHADPGHARQFGYIVSFAADPWSQRVWSEPWNSWILLNDDWTVTLLEGTRPWATPSFSS